MKKIFDMGKKVKTVGEDACTKGEFTTTNITSYLSFLLFFSQY
jgi:hypothetical protein